MTRTPLAAALAVAALPALAAPPRAAADDEYYDLMKVFVDTFEQIDRNYVKDVDKRELVDAAVRGMLLELDPYSNYIPPDQLADFTEDIEQEFGGIGVQVNFDRRTKSLEVVAPLPGSPAFAVGLRTGDRIVEVNGESLADFAAGQEQVEALKRLRGPAGEPVEVGVVRPPAIQAATPGPDKPEAAENSDDEAETDADGGEKTDETSEQGADGEQTEAAEAADTDGDGKPDSLLRFQIVREQIQLPTVFGYDRRAGGEWDYFLPLDGSDLKFGYVRLTSFTRRSAAEMKEAVSAIVDAGADGLVLDLRDNPGGLLTAAVETVDLFLDSGLIVRTEGRNSQPRKWSASRSSTFRDLPVAVLINNYSASASEITAAALQDHNRAVVIGTRSFGKGSVQNVIDLEGGSAALKLTTASYFRPSGKNIHRFPDAEESDEWGVLPSDGYEVEMTPQQMAKVREANRKAYQMSEERPEVDDDALERAIEVLSKEANAVKSTAAPAA